MSVTTRLKNYNHIENKTEEMAKIFSQFNVTIHDRPITVVKFNNDGDLLFTAAKDANACLVRTDGWVLGTYEGHTGAIISLDPSKDSSLMVSGGADKKIILWDISTGKFINNLTFESVVRSVSFYNSNESNMILFATDDSFGNKPLMGSIDKRTMEKVQFFDIDSTPTKSISNFSSEYVVYSDTDGYCKKIDTRTGEIILSKKFHTSRINNLKNSFCKSFFITASSDAKSKIISYDLEELKCFTSEDPINSSAIFRSNDKVLTAGGVNARDVTLTRSKANFEVNAYDIVTSKLIGAYSTHFGTINTIDINPNGEMYASGAEDGIVCVVKYGEDFENAPFTKILHDINQ